VVGEAQFWGKTTLDVSCPHETCRLSPGAKEFQQLITPRLAERRRERERERERVLVDLICELNLSHRTVDALPRISTCNLEMDDLSLD
jgi:hypothetical protein